MHRRITDWEFVELTPEGRYITGALEVVPESFVEECCDYCEEVGDEVDPLGIFRDPRVEGHQGTYHSTCADGEGLVLA